VKDIQARPSLSRSVSLPPLPLDTIFFFFFFSIFPCCAKSGDQSKGDLAKYLVAREIEKSKIKENPIPFVGEPLELI
jgi:hypothetical protein